MTIGIIYESKTGNTKLLAEAIKETCEKDNIVLFRSVEELLEDDFTDKWIDMYFLGSWTDKGDCGDLMKEFSKSLNGVKIALFGTVGFGGSAQYYKELGDKFAKHLPVNNKILGNFYTQGKMPTSIRDRYERMLEKRPGDENIIASIENFNKAQYHPNENDLEDAKIFAERMLRKYEE